MKKFALFGVGLMFAGSALAVTISGIPDIADKNTDDTLTHTEWNSVAQGVETMSSAFSGVVSDAGTVTFPGNVDATQLCIGGTCQAAWPEASPWELRMVGAIPNVIVPTGTRVGIGVTPGLSLDVEGPIRGSQFCISTNCISAWSEAATSLWTESGADINRASGNVGIGVASPAEKLDVAGNVKATGLCLGGSCISAWPAGSTSLWTESGANINRASGNVGIGVASPAEKLDIAGNVKATAFLYSSDERLKKNIAPIANALDIVKNLTGVTFEWKADGEKSLGFIAQDVESVLPELVKGEEMKSVAYGNITAVLVEAIKEQQKQIDELRAELDALK